MVEYNHSKERHRKEARKPNIIHERRMIINKRILSVLLSVALMVSVIASSTIAYAKLPMPNSSKTTTVTTILKPQTATIKQVIIGGTPYTIRFKIRFKKTKKYSKNKLISTTVMPYKVSNVRLYEQDCPFEVVKTVIKKVKASGNQIEITYRPKVPIMIASVTLPISLTDTIFIYNKKYEQLVSAGYFIRGNYKLK